MGIFGIRGTGLWGEKVAQVDPTHLALRTSLRPMEHGVFGHYAGAWRSGAITGAAVVAGAPIFSCRWASSSAWMVLTKLKAVIDVTTILTADQEIGTDLIFAKSFTGPDSAGTQINAAATSVFGKMNNQMSESQLSLSGDLRIAVATLLTAGTRTLDSWPVAMAVSRDRDTNAAAGTPFLPVTVSPANTLLFEQSMARGEHPKVIQQNEGFLVRNLVLLPAAGVYTLTVEMSWSEVDPARFYS